MTREFQPAIPVGVGARHPGFWRRFLPVWALGLLGVATLLLQPVPAALLEQAPPLRELPGWVVRLVLLANPLVLVTASALLGAVTAHRVGFRSALAGLPDDRPLPWGSVLLGGVVLAAVLAGLDALWAPFLGDAWARLQAEQAGGTRLTALILGVGYGGLAEEVMMRWGLMSALVWALARLTAAGRRPYPPSWVFLSAAVLSAAVFAAGHLPALAAAVPLTPALVARTLLLSLVAGVAYGALYWRRGLEAAMLAHAGTHLGFALLRAASVI